MTDASIAATARPRLRAARTIPSKVLRPSTDPTIVRTSVTQPHRASKCPRRCANTRATLRQFRKVSANVTRRVWTRASGFHTLKPTMNVLMLPDDEREFVEHLATLQFRLLLSDVAPAGVGRFADDPR